VEVPGELRLLLKRSIQYSERTQGAFDVTWRGMGNIWHCASRRISLSPRRLQVETARRNIDYHAIKITGNSIYLPEGKTSVWVASAKDMG
jgi:thiamine biosynthesis lipoprotein ApbE